MTPTGPRQGRVWSQGHHGPWDTDVDTKQDIQRKVRLPLLSSHHISAYVGTGQRVSEMVGDAGVVTETEDRTVTGADTAGRRRSTDTSDLVAEVSGTGT